MQAIAPDFYVPFDGTSQANNQERPGDGLFGALLHDEEARYERELQAAREYPDAARSGRDDLGRDEPLREEPLRDEPLRDERAERGFPCTAQPNKTYPLRLFPAMPFGFKHVQDARPRSCICLTIERGDPCFFDPLSTFRRHQHLDRNPQRGRDFLQ